MAETPNLSRLKWMQKLSAQLEMERYAEAYRKMSEGSICRILLYRANLCESSLLGVRRLLRP